MAYSPIEQSYVDGVVSVEFPDPIIEEPQQEQPMMLADSGQVKSDAQAGFGTIGPIPRTKAQEALGYVGDLLTRAGVQLDKVGLDIPLLGRITLKDLTVGESGKVLEDMSYGFMPVEGAGGFISGTTRIKPDEALELLNLAPVVGAAAKVGGKAVVKGATKAVEATKGLPVGMSIKEVGQGVDELGFYSAAKQAVDSIQQPKGTGEQFLKQIEKTPGVKPEEIKWTGLDDFLKSKKTVTKAEVQEYLDKNRVEVKEVQLGAVDEAELQAFLNDEAGQGFTRQEAIEYLGQGEGSTKFSKYTLPGGENYREILLTLPTKMVSEAEARTILNAAPDAKLSEADIAYASRKQADEFRSQHFDQPNILAHMRVNDRVDADGKKVLFVEEVQSDWHQAGRKKGYNTPEQRAKDQKRLDELDAERKMLEAKKARLETLAEPFTSQGKDAPADILDQWNMTANRLNNLQREYAPIANQLATGGSNVPDAPFKTTWHELALKRAIQVAAEGGYDRIAFTTGKTQAERYDLSKQVDTIAYRPDGTGKFEISAIKDGNSVMTEYGKTVDDIENLVGKDIAKKIANGEGNVAEGFRGEKGGVKELSGVDLQVGGEGMKGFYDQILPKFLDKYAKKWDAKVGTTQIRLASDKQDMADSELLGELGLPKGGKAMADVQYIDITPKMKESVLTKGQPLFAIGAGGAAVQQEENK